jgi:hypothetical protein
MTDAPGPRQPPVFVERQTYRRRRLADSARALPVLGLLLWLVPLLWGLSGEAPRTSAALIYLFGVWIALILGAAAIIAALGPDTADRRPPPRAGSGRQ